MRSNKVFIGGVIILIVLLLGISIYFVYNGNNSLHDNINNSQEEYTNLDDRDTVENISSNGEYSVEELEEMALDYYEINYGERPPLVSSILDDSGMVVIQLYSFNNDHNSTRDYYTIDPESGVGTNVMGKVIDLTSVLE